MDPDAFQFHKLPNTPGNQFSGHHIISDQVSRDDIGVVWRELEKVLQSDVPGAVVELGCYAGTTSLFIRRLLDHHQSQRAFHVYDSFEGLPPKQGKDESAAGVDFQQGKLSVSKKEFLQQFRAAGLRPPVVHKGWFEEMDDQDVPDQIAFAFLDGDFYSSILSSLYLVWPRMAPGGRVLIDDYHREALPGVDRALDKFFAGNLPASLRAEHNIAIIEV
jgi:O-methyltransferase